VLDEHDLTNDKAPDGFISEQSFLKANEIIIPTIKDYLTKGKSVIIDGNFYRKAQIENLIENLEFDHYVFTLHAPLEECIKRDTERDKTHGPDAVRVVCKVSTSFDYGKTIESRGKTRDQVVQEIQSEISKKE